MSFKLKKTVIFGALVGAVALSAWNYPTAKYTAETPLWTVLNDLGKPMPIHAPDKFDAELAERGKEIFTTGITTGPDGKRTKRQSKHFVCTDCHNTVQEDPDLRISNPDTRLDYAITNNIPFLQGTTMYGTVNRKHWYNDDYVKKYGDLVKPAQDTLVNAIRVCTIECSQGRALSEWEMQAMLQYLWSIQLKLGDLNLPQDLLDKINIASPNNISLIKKIEEYFLDASPAHAARPMDIDKRKMGESGDINRGQYIYVMSCLKCHEDGRKTNYMLDRTVLSAKSMYRNFDKWTKKSIYNIVRDGTYPQLAYHPYMPYYTVERMSDSQLEDLAAYIKQTSGK